MDSLYERRTILMLDTSLQKHSCIAITLRRAQFLYKLLIKQINKKLDALGDLGNTDL